MHGVLAHSVVVSSSDTTVCVGRFVESAWAIMIIVLSAVYAIVYMSNHHNEPRDSLVELPQVLDPQTST